MSERLRTSPPSFSIHPSWACGIVRICHNDTSDAFNFKKPSYPQILTHTSGDFTTPDPFLRGKLPKAFLFNLLQTLLISSLNGQCTLLILLPELSFIARRAALSLWDVYILKHLQKTILFFHSLHLTKGNKQNFSGLEGFTEKHTNKRRGARVGIQASITL